MRMTRIKGWLLVASFVATAAHAGGEAQAQMLPKWHLAGQLELAPGEVIGPLTVSPLGELVAGTTWDGAGRFTGRVWSMMDGLQVSQLEQPFPALLEIRFGQSPYDLNTMAASVYAHTRRELRSWSVADGRLLQALEFDRDVLANDVLYDPHRETYVVSQDIGGLLVYAATGEAIDTIEVDALRPHYGMYLANDGGLLVVDSAAFTLTAAMTGLPYCCAPVAACAEAYQALPVAYGPYEALLAFDPQGHRVATLPEVDPGRVGAEGGNYRPVATPTVRVWNDVSSWTSDAEPDLALAGFASAPVWGMFSADGTRLLTLEEAGHLTIWDMGSGRQEFRLEATGSDGVIAARFIPDGASVFVHWASGASQIVETRQGVTILELPQPSTDVVVAPDGRTLISYAIGEASARVWRRR